ncbi:NADH-FMN oxidoreductase RutF, flavin reductase (DIM6/NTAB) family [Natronincola peptidivorans]|uniref:NADH-FMN oxidoreductase RutF, flavin reductase (DIM6/NTAB) family n=1 Tax=Natronincola peptidivorans TaxID=426128 RepID=A0A1I0GFB0_9FIRM|nr:flavin reductase family protein [Natronincola peptidivorans]SET68964.1 NADH-FMN oxidoreductase RutF, flavin reductase (DIM6/NTAB) family [Natronincola peptidivorans]
MNKKAIEFPQYSTQILQTLKEGRVLLVAEGKDGKPNPMTIAWGSIMFAWNKPIFVAMVRGSRHTYKLIEESDSFTVNFFTAKYKKEMAFCGTKSGRDYDKFKETGLTPTSAKTVATPVIKEAFINVECKIVSKEKMDQQFLEKSIMDQYYSLDDTPGKDLHFFYFGEIVEMYKEEAQDDIIETVFKDNWL